VQGRARSAFCDGLGPAPCTAGPVGGNPFVRECPHRSCWEPENGRARSTRAGDQRADRPSVTDPISLNQNKGAKQLFFFFNLLFLKSPPRNPLLADLIIATLFLLKFSFSPWVRVVHRSQFQATSALWSKASNLHYSLMRLPPLPPLPSPPNTHNSLTPGSVTAVKGAGPGLVNLL
jgi:hypothetical protein